jgi:hypothetical protein
MEGHGRGTRGSPQRHQNRTDGERSAVGYLTVIERHRVWEIYKRAGKIDDLTKG